MKPIELVSDYLEEIGFTKRGMSRRSDDRLATCSFWIEYSDKIFLRFTRRYYFIRIDKGTMMVVSVFRDRYATRDVSPLEEKSIGSNDLVTLTRDLHEADSLKWLADKLRYFDELIIGSEKLWFPDNEKQRSP